MARRDHRAGVAEGGKDFLTAGAFMSGNKTSILDNIFVGSGFNKINSELLEFELSGKKSEIDCIYLYENVLIIAEETAGRDRQNTHFPKKKAFHEIIASDYHHFIEVYSRYNLGFKDAIQASEYYIEDFVFRHVYFSESKDMASEIGHERPFIIITPSTGKYLDAVVSTIGQSARYELLKLLGIQLKEVGDNCLSGRPNSVPEDSFQAFVLSHRQTNYPKDFYLVSFYADPMSLISRAYVLRRDGWDGSEVAYQRILDSSKLIAMREHLSRNEKVYVNNLVVTLPSNVTVHEMVDGMERQVSLSDASKAETVKIKLPQELATVGIIDGQHRIFSYHEGDDKFESSIRRIRKRQNLLVTGIVFPAGYNDDERLRFEAELFLKINDTQTTVDPALRQEIEVIVDPMAPRALATAIIASLREKGPLKGLLIKSAFDDNTLVKTATIVNHGLKPLVSSQFKSSQALYYLWFELHGSELTESNRGEFVHFCRDIINAMLVGSKKNLDRSQWKPRTRSGKQFLGPVFINGLLICLRKLVEDNVVKVVDGKLLQPDYEAQFSGLSKIDIDSYFPNKWSELGGDLYGTYFNAVGD